LSGTAAKDKDANDGVVAKLVDGSDGAGARRGKRRRGCLATPIPDAVTALILANFARRKQVAGVAA
jgi:hypothetical protein